MCECNKEIAAVVIDIISMDLASASYGLIGYLDWIGCTCVSVSTHVVEYISQDFR